EIKTDQMADDATSMSRKRPVLRLAQPRRTRMIERKPAMNLIMRRIRWSYWWIILWEVDALTRRKSHRSITDLPKNLPRKKKVQSPRKVPINDQKITGFSWRYPSFANMAARSIVVSPSRKVPMRTPT